MTLGQIIALIKNLTNNIVESEIPGALLTVPTANGQYMLTVTVNNGQHQYEWWQVIAE